MKGSERADKWQKFGKVAVLGAAGGIGQPLSLLLKNDSSVSELNLYDIANTRGVASDLSHINSAAKVCPRLPSRPCSC